MTTRNSAPDPAEPDRSEEPEPDAVWCDDMHHAFSFASRFFGPTTARNEPWITRTAPTRDCHTLEVEDDS